MQRHQAGGLRARNFWSGQPDQRLAGFPVSSSFNESLLSALKSLSQAGRILEVPWNELQRHEGSSE